MNKTALAVVLLGSALSCAHRYPGAKDENRGLRVSGEGRATAAPDEVSLVLGVRTEAKTAGQAGSENARVHQAILAAVKQILPSNSIVQTQGYNVSAVYAQPQPNGQPVISGYQVSNSVHIVTPDLASVGRVIDAALGNGANQVDSLNFGLKDPTPLQDKALADAVARARAQAEILAKGLGLTIKGVKLVETGGMSAPIPVPLFKASFARTEAADATTPVEGGRVIATAQVTVTFDTTP